MRIPGAAAIGVGHVLAVLRVLVVRPAARAPKEPVRMAGAGSAGLVTRAGPLDHVAKLTAPQGLAVRLRHGVRGPGVGAVAVYNGLIVPRTASDERTGITITVKGGVGRTAAHAWA